jgi:hypothetical protein
MLNDLFGSGQPAQEPFKVADIAYDENRNRPSPIVLGEPGHAWCVGPFGFGRAGKIAKTTKATGLYLLQEELVRLYGRSERARALSIDVYSECRLHTMSCRIAPTALLVVVGRGRL